MKYIAKVPFLNPKVKCVTKIINFHDTCTCTKDYNVDLGLSGKIRQLEAAACFCVRRMWRYYSPLTPFFFLPRVVSPLRLLLTVQIKRAKNGRRVTPSNPWLFTQPLCCTSFQSRAVIFKSIIAEDVVKGRPFPFRSITATFQ
jgi:hypothetical protein